MVVAARWALGSALAVFSLWIMALNWLVVARRFMTGGKSSSWIPLLGGGCGIAAILLLPLDVAHSYWWLPLLVDWGCAPGFVHAGLFRVATRFRS
jgi:hypothetical protein